MLVIYSILIHKRRVSNDRERQVDKSVLPWGVLYVCVSGIAMGMYRYQVML